MYQAIYRKYRPTSFNDVFGQKHITDTLVNQLKTGRVSHAYLFTGTRGTGKTTCAKILARAVNCENLKDGNPCGVCDACVAVLNGSAIDVTEMDAASHTGVDNIRSILDEVMYPPSELKKRVYIIDEVHMLSQGAFNALLKTLEEPPAYVLFILATTELHKVPATILSRCQRFDFRRVEPKEIAVNLSQIAEKENIPLSAGAIGLISRLADGSVRDSLSILERCTAEDTDQIDEAMVLTCVGGAEFELLDTLARAVLSFNAVSALEQIELLYRSGRDLRSVFDALCTMFRDVLIVKSLPTGWESFVSPGANTKNLSDLANISSSQQLGNILTVLSDTINRMQRSGGNRTEAELALIRLCTPSAVMTSATSESNPMQSSDTASLTARIQALEQRLAELSAMPKTVAQTNKHNESKDTEKQPQKTEKKPSVPKESVLSQSGTLLSPDKQKLLLDRLKGSLSRSAYVTLTMAELSVQNNKLRIVADDDLSLRVLNDHSVKQSITEAASEVLGTTAQAEILSPSKAKVSSATDSSNGIDLLAELGRASGIEVNIK